MVKDAIGLGKEIAMVHIKCDSPTVTNILIRTVEAVAVAVAVVATAVTIPQ